MTSSGKKILITNDDGIFSEGIKALATALVEFTNAVVVAPDKEQSAVGHGITIRRPLRCKKVSSFGSVEAYSVDGTPADCVVIGSSLFGKPDLVVSGINLGANLGEDLTHSGTVAAAIEGINLGVPSIAFSQLESASYDFSSSVEFAAKLVRSVLEKGLPPKVILNVNFPVAHSGKAKITKVGNHSWSNEVFTRTDPNGNNYYWVGGVSHSDEAGDLSTDYGAAHAGIISVSPLRIDLTAHDLLGTLSSYIE